MDDKEDLIAEINDKYDLGINKVMTFERKDDGNSNLLLKLQGEKQLFFFKEIPSHSARKGLDHIYSELALLNPKYFKLALPLISNRKKYCEEILSMQSMIYPFIDHDVFAESNIPIEGILSSLNELHDSLQNLNIATHPFKTYQNWFERGLEQIKKRVDNHPFLDMFHNFIECRFRKINFIMGNCHFDLNPYNVWITKNNELYFSDFDNCQVAALAKDFFDITSRYLIFSEESFNISAENLDKIRMSSHKYIKNLNHQDFRFLLIRPKLGSLFSLNNGLTEQQIKKKLHQFVRFLSV